MAAELKWQLDVETELVAGGRGEFTVWVGERKVADKSTAGDFPSPADVVEAVSELLRAGEP